MVDIGNEQAPHLQRVVADQVHAVPPKRRVSCSVCCVVNLDDSMLVAVDDGEASADGIGLVDEVDVA